MRNINIVFTCNDEYIKYCCTCIASILYNMNNEYHINFYIISTDISPDSENKINKIDIKKSYSINFIHIEREMLSIFEQIEAPSHISIDTYIRLLIPNLLKKIDKIIYLDCDILVRKDISMLYNEDIKDYSFAMVKDAGSDMHSKRLFNSTNNTYFNAGVMLMNLEKLRKDNYFDRIKEQIDKDGYKYKICDQDIINDVFKNEIKRISYTYNFYHSEYLNKEFIPEDMDEYKKIESDPLIIHFVGPNKIWYPTVKGRYKKEYIKYLKMTPFYKPIMYQTLHNENSSYKFITIFGYILFYKRKSENKNTYYMFGIKIHRKHKHTINKISMETKNSLNIFDQYKKNHKIKKLQICSGKNHLPGWLNTDLFYNREEQIGHLNVLEKFPFEDNTFDYVYSEHGVEHFEVPELYSILLEVHRCMTFGGWLRIVTPDLQKLIKFYQEDSEINNQYMTLQTNAYEPFLVNHGVYNKCFVLNDFFRLWGHKNIYDETALMEICRLVGFRNIRHSELQHSEIPQFTGIARHVVFHDFDINTFESMVIECQK